VTPKPTRSYYLIAPDGTESLIDEIYDNEEVTEIEQFGSDWYRITIPGGGSIYIPPGWKLKSVAVYQL